MASNERLHAGHRGRMRTKFALYGRDVFHTHELLEMLLFHAIPCKNTNPIAENLILRFSNLDGVFSTSRDELMSVEGVGPRVADMILSVAQIDVMKSEDKPALKSGFCFDNYCGVGKFFVEYFTDAPTYSTAALYLNNKMEYLECVHMGDYDYASAAIRVKPFIDEAIKLRAAVCIIAHNHPYGPAFPTEGDISTNCMMSDALTKAGIFLAEHYVVSGDAYVGFMNNLSAAFSQSVEIQSFLASKEDSDE